MEISCTVRLMKPEEVNIAVAWARQEGWNPGIHDGECFFKVDPSGFFIAEQDEKPVATAVVANYTPEFAFGGFFIVHPDYRGKGVGTCISRSAMAHAGSRNLGIDGVLAMQSRYTERDGFIFAYRNKRFEGMGEGRSQRVWWPGTRFLSANSTASTGNISLPPVHASLRHGLRSQTAARS